MKPAKPPKRAIDRLRREVREKDRQVRESLVALDNLLSPSDWLDAGDGFPGFSSRRWALPGSRAQDRTHAPVAYLNEEEWRQHVALARDLVTRNHLAIGFRDHVSNFIGPVTISFVLRGQTPGASASGPVDADGDGEPDVDPLVKAATQVWEEWRELAEWGEGKQDREAECRRRLIVEGEATLRFFNGDSNSAGLPYARHIEPELIRTPPGYSTTDRFGWGVISRDEDDECEEGIWLCRPDNVSLGREIALSEYVRVKGNVDRTVKRGLSDFFPVAAHLSKVLALLDNMAHVAKVQAAIAWWESHPNATEDQVRRMIQTSADGTIPKGPAGRTSKPGRNVDVSKLEAGTVPHTEAGRVVVPGPTSEPTGFLAIEAAVLRAVGFRWGCPSYFSGDADASFASVLVTGSPFVRITESRQEQVKGFARDVATRVIQFCERTGRLPRGTSQRVRPVANVKPVVIADEEKKSRTFLAEYAAGVADPQAYIRSKGGDPKVVSASAQAWKAKNPPQAAQQPRGSAGGPAPKDPTSTPPASAGGDGTSPNDGGIFGEALVKEGFTGTIKDTQGRERHYVDGKQVAKPPSASGGADPFSATKAAIAQATDPVAKDYLESALHNATAGDPRDLAQQLASVWMHAHDQGHAAAQAAVERLLPAVGAELTGPSKGEPVKHSGALYSAPVGMFPGDAAVVVRPPVVLPDGKVLVKGQVAPPKRESIKAIRWEDRTITVKLSNGTTFQRHIKGSAVDAAAPDHVHELHGDDAHAIAGGIDKDIAALPEGQKPPAGVVAKAKDLALTAAVKVYEWSIRLSPAAQKIGGLIGEILDTPSDMARLGYNPNMSSGTANVKNADAVSANLNDALGFGISGHLVASIASKVIVKAGYWAVNKVRGEEVDTDDGFGMWAAMIAELFAHLNTQLGVEGGTPDAATVEKGLRELVAGRAK